MDARYILRFRSTIVFKNLVSVNSTPALEPLYLLVFCDGTSSRCVDSESGSVAPHQRSIGAVCRASCSPRFNGLEINLGPIHRRGSSVPNRGAGRISAGLLASERGRYLGVSTLTKE